MISRREQATRHAIFIAANGPFVSPYVMRKASSCALVAFLGYRCRGEEGGGLIIRSTRAWLPLALAQAMEEIEDDWKTGSVPNAWP